MSHNQLHKKEQARKLEQDRLQIILNELLREEENKYCADCEAKGPRWASWNLGVFLCIRCAGIHRNLGVHVSKVKSINLDTWTPEQVQSVRVLGNSIAKAVYEANLPEHFRRPQTDSSLETFIRAKYEHKRYSAKDFELPKIDVRSLLHELDNFALRHNKKSATSNVPSSKCTTNFDPPKTCSENKDEKIKGSKSQNKPELAETNGSNAECDLLGLSIESSCSLNQPTDYSNSDNNDFGDFASAFSSVNDKPVSVSDSFALIDTELKGTGDKKTTIDILALYGPKSNQTISHSTNFAMPLVTDQSKSSTTSFNSDLASLIGGGVGQAPHQGFSTANNVFAPTIVGGANVSLTNLTNSNAATFPTPTMMYQRPVVSPFYSMNNPQSTVQSAEFAALNPFSNRPPAFKAGQQMPNQYAPLPQYFGPPASSVNQQPSIVLNSAHLSAGSLPTLGSLTNSNTGIVSSSLANQNLQAVQDQLAALKMKKNETATPPSKTATINGDLWH